MKKLITLLLVLAMLISSMAVLSSCGSGKQPDNDEVTNDPNGDGTNDNAPNGSPTIKVPEYKDYGRDTVNFSELKYSRPDVASLISALKAVSEAIKLNKISFDEQLAMIVDLEDDYDNFLTMYTLAEIYNSIDTTSDFWLEEYTYISTNYSSFSQAVEDMFVAAAQSEYKTAFEDEYFGTSLDDYVDGGIYTDALVELLADEAALEAEYSSLTTATVTITLHDGTTGTVDELLEKVPESEYLQLYTYYMTLYQQEYNELVKDIYIELVKTRILIAEEMGYDSYTDVAYESMGHDYSSEKMLAFLADIQDIYKIYTSLYYEIFYKYDYYGITVSKSNYIDVINHLYDLYSETDEDIADIYAYMLQYGLFSIENTSDSRLDASFTTYIDSNNSPFIFMSADGNFEDYLTLSHEFGHFVDFYVNDGDSASLDLSEVYSQALEFITLLDLKGDMSADAAAQQSYMYLLHSEVDMIFNTLFYQGFLAMFEHLVYELDYSEVTEAKLESLIVKAQNDIWGFEIPSLQGWDSVLILHTVQYPFYVQSYCTSLVAAVEIMLLEIEEENAGLEAYKILVSREDTDELNFEDQLLRAGVGSPFRDGALEEMAEAIYYFLRGYEYGSSGGGSNAA